MPADAGGSLVIDTSAAVAVILDEPGGAEIAVHLEDARGRGAGDNAGGCRGILRGCTGRSADAQQVVAHIRDDEASVS